MKFAALLFALATLAAPAKLVTRTIDYADAHGTPLEGYVVYDDAKAGPRPGVIIIHDWRGLTDYTKKRADMIAQLGYVAFAADIYGKGVHPDERPRLFPGHGALQGRPKSLYRARVHAAYNAVSSASRKSTRRAIAAIGYCFGGTGVIEMVRDGVPRARRGHAFMAAWMRGRSRKTARR